LYIIVALALTFSACQKESEVISGNVAMSDPTVSLTQIRQYVQKVYLAIVGTSPVDSILDQEIYSLARTNCSPDARADLLNRLFAMPAFKNNQYTIKNDQLLGGMSVDDINDIIDDIQDDLNTPGTSINEVRLQEELAAMQRLRSAKQEYAAGTITLVEVQKRMTESVAFYYVNGSGNSWIDAVYTNFLFRLPTNDERDQINTMLSGFPGYLFLQTGSSTNDFIQIFFSSSSFLEGQVREQFRNNLFREPTTSELLNYSNLFRSNNDHQQLMRQIFLSNEFLRGN
jgi:hypothetical protein